MNKTVLYIMTFVLFLGILLTQKLTLEKTKDMLGGDPTKIANWMATNIKTAHEDMFYAQPPKYLFKYRKGDCEDWAILSRYFIGDKYETHLVVWQGKFREDSKYYAKMKNIKMAHCVLAIKLSEDNWNIIDQGRHIIGGESLVDIIKINCNLRKVKPIKAFIMDLYRFRRKKIKEIDLEVIK